MIPNGGPHEECPVDGHRFDPKVQPVEKPKCKLAGKDGNVFSIIGLVSTALKKADQHEKAKEFQQRAMAAKSYDEVLQMVHEYVDAT